MNKKIYAFIDSQNLNLGTNKDITKKGKIIYRGWKLDFKKFRRYLTDKFRVNKALLYSKSESSLLKRFQQYKIF